MILSRFDPIVADMTSPTKATPPPTTTAGEPPAERVDRLTSRDVPVSYLNRESARDVRRIAWRELERDWGHPDDDRDACNRYERSIGL